MGQFIDLTGSRFGRLVVTQCLHIGGLDRATGKRRNTEWECRCDCGRTTVTRTGELTKGKSKSCGCLRRDLITTHGMSNTSEYHVWEQMIRRCTKETSRSYKNYGARGIEVCERWLKFENFYADMGNRPQGRFTLERKDNNGGYSPENCIWATYKQQCNNTRANRFLTYKGVTKTLTQWCEELCLNLRAVRKRLNTLMWSVDRALSSPTKTPFSKRIR